MTVGSNKQLIIKFYTNVMSLSKNVLCANFKSSKVIQQQRSFYGFDNFSKKHNG